MDSVMESIGNKKSAVLDEFDVGIDGGKILTSIDDKRQQFTDLIQRKKKIYKHGNLNLNCLRNQTRRKN